MKLKRAGFFRELSYGDPEGASLIESRRDVSGPFEESILGYLASGHLLIATPGPTTDLLSSNSRLIAPPHILTDGTWAWPNDLAFYVEQYHVEVPHDFIEHMRQNNFQVPQRLDLSVLEF